MFGSRYHCSGKQWTRDFSGSCAATVDTALQPITDIRSGTAHRVRALVAATHALGFLSIPSFSLSQSGSGVLAEVDSIYGRAPRKPRRCRWRYPDALCPSTLDRRRIARAAGWLPRSTASARRNSRLGRAIDTTEGGDASLMRSTHGRGRDSCAARLQYSPSTIRTGCGSPGALRIGSGLCEDRSLLHQRPRARSAQAPVRARVVELAHILAKVEPRGSSASRELHACRDAGCDLVQASRRSAEFGRVRIEAGRRSVDERSDRRHEPRAVDAQAEDIVMELARWRTATS